MLKARIIPCLDVMDGRVVKGVNFVNLQDAGDPTVQPRQHGVQDGDAPSGNALSAHEGLDLLGRRLEGCVGRVGGV